MVTIKEWLVGTWNCQCRARASDDGSAMFFRGDLARAQLGNSSSHVHILYGVVTFDFAFENEDQEQFKMQRLLNPSNTPAR